MRIWTACFSCLLMLTQAYAADEPEAAPAKSVADSKDPKPKNERSKEAAKTSPHKPLTEAEIAAMVKVKLAQVRKARAARLAEARAKAEAEMAAANAAKRNTEHWSYEGESGPLEWGKINPAWAKCATGTRQSPIDIRNGIKVDLEPIAFDYWPTRFNVLNNGHTVQVTIPPGNRMTLTGRTYELVQFHFHHPSEEKVEGRGFDMVAHLVHKDAVGRQAVVAVLIESGRPHSLIQSIWNNLPLEKNEPLEPVTTIDVNMLLPQRRDYYTYMGSLTEPPCSEGVLWIVMKEPIQVTPQQLEIFSRLYPMNARPVQPDSGRLIKESN